MPEQESRAREFAQGAGRFFGHVAAIVIGILMMIVGLAMGVSMVLLPIGIVVGIAGLFVFLWGLVSYSRIAGPPTTPPGQG